MDKWRVINVVSFTGFGEVLVELIVEWIVVENAVDMDQKLG